MKYHYKPKTRAEERADAAWEFIIAAVALVAVSATVVAVIFGVST